jgi:hypothetical protein
MTVANKACAWALSTYCRLAAVIVLSVCVVPLHAAVPTTAHTLKVIVQPGYLPQIPTLIRVELLTVAGQPDRNVWDAEAILSETAPGITLSTNRIMLRNGLGTGLINITGSGDFDLHVTAGPLQVTRALRDRSADSVTRIGGTLSGAATTWSGVVNVTNDVTVPSGHTLTIESNTLVLINGVAGGAVAPDLIVNGSVQSLGTEAHPVTITCSANNLRFGQIAHANAQPSLYRFTSISRGGRSSGVGHTSGFGGPLFRPTNSRIVFENSNLTDNSGKIMHAGGSDLIMDNCVLARAIMGPEIGSTGLLCTNTYIMEMSSTDDGDGIYLNSSGARLLKLTQCVVAGLTGLTDDGIDTQDANVTIEDCIIRDWFHPSDDPKGISTFNGTVRIIRCLIQDCAIGISAKAHAPPARARVFIESSTVGGITNAVAAAIKSNAAGPDIGIHITNSIVRSVDALRSDFSAALTNFVIGYCDVSEAFAGAGNFDADPLYVDVSNHDFHLRAGSPCIDTGNPASPLDPDGSRIDIGCFTFEVPRPLLTARRPMGVGPFEVIFSGYTNRNYAIDYSTNGQTWGTLTTISHSEDPEIISDSSSDGPMRIYRARLVP